MYQFGVVQAVNPALPERNGKATPMTVAAILKNRVTTVITAAPSDSVQAAAEKMARHGIGALAVVDAAGDVLGTIFERDVVRALAEKASEAGTLTVSMVMTADAPSCTPESSEQDLLELMAGQRLQHLTVMKDGHLAGIVSLADVVRLRLEKIANMMTGIESEARHGWFTAQLRQGRSHGMRAAG